MAPRRRLYRTEIMTTAPTRPCLVTHSGKFHCDEAFAHAVLQLALNLHRRERIIRCCAPASRI